MKNLLLLGLLLFVVTLNAQPPSTNIYLFDYLEAKDGSVVLNAPRLLTAKNINGYNNQPKWFSNGELFFTRQMSDSEQTDLIALDVANEKEKRFTKTRQSEYSATPTPDGRHLSCIRVEDDGVQVLWQYPLDKSHGGKRILSHVRDIGYHQWINETEVMLFIVGNPLKCIIANTENSEIYEVTTKIGRCFGKMEDGSILYVYKYTEDIWHIKAYNPTTKRSKFIAETPKGSEDFVLIEGSIVMGIGSKLLQTQAPYTTWTEIADLSSYDITTISRMAYQKGRLAVVAQ